MTDDDDGFDWFDAGDGPHVRFVFSELERTIQALIKPRAPEDDALTAKAWKQAAAAIRKASGP